MKFFSLCALLMIFAGLWSGCATSRNGYGYMATGLNQESIVNLFDVVDEAVNSGDFATYISLLGPGFRKYDNSHRNGYGYSAPSKAVLRPEFVDWVRATFEDAKRIDLQTEIMSIEFEEAAPIATVEVREERNTLSSEGSVRSTVSIVEYRVGYEDGWVFFKRAETKARQEIRV